MAYKSIFFLHFMATTLECWEQYWTSPGDNTPRDTNYTATCLPSRKLYRLDEPDTPDTAGEARASSNVAFSNRPLYTNAQVLKNQLELIYNSSLRIQCSLEDQPEAMDDRDGWQERVREICTQHELMIIMMMMMLISIYLSISCILKYEICV